MSAIVTRYFSMFRQNASGANCGMITTGDPIMIAKGSNMTAPGIGPLSLSLQKRRATEAYQRCGRMVEFRVSRPFPSGWEGTLVG